MTGRALEVLRPGALTLLQDAGRRGYAAIGVSTSGAADLFAFGLGALLVGNDPARDAALEVTLGGLSVRAHGTLILALTGADAGARVGERQVVANSVFYLRPGEVLTLGVPRSGFRTYLSAHGGMLGPVVLGSRSTDTLSGLGPPPVKAGDLVPVGESTGTHPVVDHVPLPPITEPVLDLLPGPRLDWLDDPAALAGRWRVSAHSNRVGVRLEGAAVSWAADRTGRELPSEPTVRGAVQLPPNGQPVVFGPDHPVTGGYPVVAVLTQAAGDRLAQVRPGEQVTLRWAGRAPGGAS